MGKKLTVKELQEFEKDIFKLFEGGEITSPIHLRGGNEEKLIEIFKDINEEDYCFLTWASHLECLLKGVPPEDVRRAILNNKSICLSFKEHNIISSAIVGGNAPIAVGVAQGIKMRGESGKVFCFMGDMSFFTGSAQESIRYSLVNDLPIKFVIADNGLSVTTPTREVWGDIKELVKDHPKCIYYEYNNTYPHAGIGRKVMF